MGPSHHRGHCGCGSQICRMGYDEHKRTAMPDSNSCHSIQSLLACFDSKIICTAELISVDSTLCIVVVWTHKYTHTHTPLATTFSLPPIHSPCTAVVELKIQFTLLAITAWLHALRATIPCHIMLPALYGACPVSDVTAPGSVGRAVLAGDPSELRRALSRLLRRAA